MNGIIPSFDGFERKLSSGTGGVMSKVGGASGTQFGDAAGKTAGSRFGSVFKNAAKAGLVGVAALGVGAFKLAKDSISAASDLEESTNKVQQVFGEGAESVFKFSAKAADALGQTNQAARDAAATFGLFGNIAGLSDKKSAKFATKMTTLASDLASFHNTEPSEAVEALGAALRGEAEPIRSFGVLLDEATLKAEALRLGLLEPVKDQAKIKGYQVAILEGQKNYNDAVDEFGPKSLEALKAEAALGTARDRLKKATEGTIPALTQQQKVLAAQSAIFKQTEVAQGDFARTSDGLANQQRRLSARFEDAKAKLGVGLLPIMTDAADFLLDKGIPAFEDFSEWFNQKGIPAIGGFVDDAKPLAKSILPTLEDAFTTIKDVAEDAAPVVKTLFDGFNKLPDGLKSAILIGAGATFAAKKFSGSSSLLGTAVNAVKPMRVFETNPAALGGGLGGGTAGGAAAGRGGFWKTLAKGAGPAIAYTIAYEFQKEFPKLAPFGEEGFLPKDPMTIVNRLNPSVAAGNWIGDKITDVTGLGDEATKTTGRLDTMFDGVVTDVNQLRGGLGRLGQSRAHPEVLVPNFPNERNRLDAFDEKLILVGKRKVRPHVGLTGIPRAQADLRELQGALESVAAVDFTGISAFAAAGVSALDRGRNGGRPRNAGRDRQRSRNLGGHP